jgi:hypothetical protein
MKPANSADPMSALSASNVVDSFPPRADGQPFTADDFVPIDGRQSAKLFRIKQPDGSIVEQEPILGGWYVGYGWTPPVYIQDDGSLGPLSAVLSEPDPTQDGAIAQYVGEGEFYDEDCDEPTRMQDYDHIVFSHQGRL